MLKADLHLHSSEDKKDRVEYSAKELIDVAKEKGFGVLSFTFHEVLFYPEDIVNYAKERGILLIPGIELSIEGKHTLLYNFSQDELDEIRSFEELKKIKKAHHLVVAPHPFFPGSTCLRELLKKHVDVFDGVEFSQFHNPKLNFNKKGVVFAKKYNLPLIATSDLHLLNNFGKQFSLVNAKKDIDSVISSIKKGKVKIVSSPLSIMKMGRDVIWHALK